jgi:hypothetical protein
MIVPTVDGQEQHEENLAGLEGAPTRDLVGRNL